MRHIRGDKELPALVDDTNYDVHYQEYRQFQKPVNVRSKGEEDLVLASVKRLEKQFEHLRTFYADDTGDTVRAIAVALPDGTVQPEDLGEALRDNVKNMKDWVGTVCDELRKGG